MWWHVQQRGHHTSARNRPPHAPPGPHHGLSVFLFSAQVHKTDPDVKWFKCTCSTCIVQAKRGDETDTPWAFKRARHTQPDAAVEVAAAASVAHDGALAGSRRLRCLLRPLLPFVQRQCGCTAPRSARTRAERGSAWRAYSGRRSLSSQTGVLQRACSCRKMRCAGGLRVRIWVM